MKRLLLNSVCVLWVLLCVLIIGFWIRSYFITDLFFLDRFERVRGGTFWIYFDVRTAKGKLGVNRLLQSSQSTDGSFEKWIRGFPHPFHQTTPPGEPDFKFGPSEKHFGVEIGHWAHNNRPIAADRARAEGHLIVVPFWQLLSLFVMIAAPFWLYWFRSGPRPGHCPKCGYDLRATPDQCPECGASVHCASKLRTETSSSISVPPARP